VLISSVLKRRITGEPIQYILGRTEFMGLEFKVNHDVFIPRPETEVLVETVMRFSRVSPTETSILDLGTGSGCIAVSLAKFLPNAKIDAVDISKEALKIAKENAGLNEVKINFSHSDLFTGLESQKKTYDIIVSNPPYIRTSDIASLQPEVRCEPRLALDGGEDGLDFYRRIIDDALYYLRKGAFLIMELGLGQSKTVKNIFQKQNNFEIMDIVKD
jgi:release factor glutamine methyltransferase